MPNMPLFDAPTNLPSTQLGGQVRPAQIRPSIVSPTLAQPVRANEQMYAGKARAGEQFGDAIQGLGDLGFRVKNVTDTAYVLGSKLKMDAAQADFETWAMTHPDTSTWDEERQSRLDPVLGEIKDGSNNLSWAAQQRLNLETTSFATLSETKTKHMAVAQELHNSEGVFVDGINQARQNRDKDGAFALVDQAVGSGVFDAKRGAIMKKGISNDIARAEVGDATNKDPFDTEAKLKETDENGAFKYFTELHPLQRIIAQKNASAIGSEWRRDTLAGWNALAASVRRGDVPAPDEAVLSDKRAVAEKQGIDVKVVDRLFIAPKEKFDEKTWGNLTEMVFKYSPQHDEIDPAVPLGKMNIEREILSSGLPADAKGRLMATLNERTKDPKLTTPAHSESVRLIEENYKLAERGTKQVIPDKTAINGFTTKIVPERVEAIQKIRAQIQTAALEWLKANPEATPSEVQQFLAPQLRRLTAASMWSGTINPKTGVRTR